MTRDQVYEILYGPNGLQQDTNRTPGDLKLKEIVAIMQDEVDKRRIDLGPQTGMRVPYHGDLCNAPPTVLKAIERWIYFLEKHI